MTSTLIARPVRPLRTPAVAAACPIEQHALRTGARTLADALTGIAWDAPCDRARQRAVLALGRLVLDGVRSADAHRADDGVRAAADAVRAAQPTFAHDVSAGAPGLAMAWGALADRLDAVAARVPAERTTPVRDAPRRVRWVLRWGEARHARLVELVRG
jgi:hypothetical protein